MTPLSPVAANVSLTCIALILAVVIPVWDYFYLKRWRQSTNPDKKVQLYRQTITWLWGLTALAWWLIPAQVLFRMPLENAHVAGLPKAPFAVGICIGVIGGLIGSTIIYWLQYRAHPGSPSKLQKQLEKVSMYLPQTPRERWWFVATSITAGICEEFLYRGFLIQYLHSFTWHFALWIALILACVVFGLGHIYQGMMGIAQTAAMGFLFGVVFVATGSLLMPIVLHTFIDLRILVLLPKGTDAALPLSPVDPN